MTFFSGVSSSVNLWQEHWKKCLFCMSRRLMFSSSFGLLFSMQETPLYPECFNADTTTVFENDPKSLIGQLSEWSELC